MFDKVIRDIRSGPVHWRMVITTGEPGDDLRDATIAWPAQRPVIEAGTVVIDGIETEEAGNARDINFDPMVLPDGIGPSDDPLLPARSAVYAASFRRRADAEGAPPEIETDEVAQ